MAANICHYEYAIQQSHFTPGIPQSLRSGRRRAGRAVVRFCPEPTLTLPSGRNYRATPLRVGLIGCGGRGSGAASQALNADKNVVLTAMGDAFEDQLQKSLQSLQKEHPDKVKVAPEKCFVGLDAYQKVIDSGVDVVLLATPPGFRPVHLKAAVDAGKHIFCEKPMATDAPGVRSVLESVKAAKEKSLSLVAGFCWRYEAARREFYRRVHEGAIGDLRADLCHLLCRPCQTDAARQRAPRRHGRSGVAVAQLV